MLDVCMCVFGAGPPEISLPRERQEVIVAGNSVVEIKCPFRSLPLPKVTWIIKIGSDGRREEINSLAGGFTYDIPRHH